MQCCNQLVTLPTCLLVGSGAFAVRAAGVPWPCALSAVGAVLLALVAGAVASQWTCALTTGLLDKWAGPNGLAHGMAS